MKWIHRVWIIIFCVWSLVLTGSLQFMTSAPGVTQWYQLQDIVRFKNEELANLEEEIRQLESERRALMTSAATQEKEIRRVLGYARSDELVFQFVKK